MIDAFSKNFIDYEEYPVSADIQVRQSALLYWNKGKNRTSTALCLKSSRAL